MNDGRGQDDQSGISGEEGGDASRIKRQDKMISMTVRREVEGYEEGTDDVLVTV